MAEIAKAPGLEYIQSPKLVAVAFNAFLVKVITNAKALKPLPKVMVTRIAQLERSQEALAVALGAKHGEDLSADPKRVAADRAVDDAVRAYFEFLSGMARLPEPIGSTATTAKTTFFPKDELGFIQLDFEEEWGEIETRVKHAEEQGHFAAVADIGGAAVISNLKKMQKEYGKALGITAASARAVATKVSEPYAAAQNSLRRFIAAAIALGAESDVDPDVIPQAEHLLAPIEELRVRLSARRGRGSKEEEGIDGEYPDGNSEPEPGPTPGGSD